LPSIGDDAQRRLGSVVVGWKTRIAGESRQRAVIPERVANGLPHGAFGEMSPALLAEPAEQLSENWPTPRLAQREMLVGADDVALPRLVLDDIQVADQVERNLSLRDASRRLEELAPRAPCSPRVSGHRSW
jgi:hypothetical protein